jgi:hypothetical protein
MTTLNLFALRTSAIALMTFIASNALNAQNDPKNAQVYNASIQQGTNVNVVNTPNVRNIDAPGRNVLQTALISFTVSAQTTFYKSFITVPPNQRLILEYISGACNGLAIGTAALRSGPQGQAPKGWLQLPFANNFVSAPVRFIVAPGDEVGFVIDNAYTGAESCAMTVTGYYITVP